MPSRAFETMDGVTCAIPGEQLALFGPPAPLWGGHPHPRSMAVDECHEGGAFLYEHAPNLFFGRVGLGALRVALDTAVLIDYGEFGEAIWDDEPFEPNVSDPEYREELLALEALMHQWTMRDIRLHVFDIQLADCRRHMSDRHSELRRRQIESLQAALRCLGHGTDQMHAAPGEVWPPAPDLTGIASGADRDVLASAIDSGCHVFLTRDKALLRKAGSVAAFWVAVLSPAGLLDALAESDELGITRWGDFLVPDSHKWSHVTGACLGPDIA